jgi:UDP-N-acetylmuramyl pentapeptide phosphotransferase/UDP-N-acetylglucosamine-1-phosphate transferase
MLTNFWPIIIATLVAWITTPTVIRLSRKMGLIDNPAKKKLTATHTTPTPRGGGLAIFVAITVTFSAF